MRRTLRLHWLVLLGVLVMVIGAVPSFSQDPPQQGQEKSDKEQQQKKKKKGGFFGGLKSITGESSEQQEVTATAGSKTVGEGERIGDVQPTSADRQKVTAMENYSVPEKDLKRFVQDGRLQPQP